MIWLTNSFRFGGIQDDPANYGNMYAWWKTDSLSLSDSTPLGNTGGGTDVPDSSGNGHVLTQATSGNRPLYRTNQFGSRPAMEFASAQRFDISSALVLSGDFTCIAIAKQVAANDGMIFGSATLNLQWRKNRTNSNNQSFWDGAGPERISGVFSSAQTDLVMMSMRRASGSITSFRENKTELTGTGSENQSVTFDELGRCSGLGGANYTGLIAEVVVYSVARSDSDMDSLFDNYFKPKWGI